MNRLITLTTDFGTSDGFVGTMKGVILGINPQATIVDITHEIAPQDVEQGAFLFAASAKYFPAETIHVVVVDPGVGSARRPIAIQVGETLFVAPDNGVLAPAIAALQRAGGSHIRAVHLNRPAYWLPRVSSTFHGRDIFAPCAAHLSLGIPLQALGEPIEDWIRLEATQPVRRADGALVARVSHIDRFGNIVINVDDEMIAGLDPRRLSVQIAGRTLQGLKTTFSDASSGDVLALLGSSGYVEIAARNSNAAQLLGVNLHDPVTVLP